jgi:hypothetical protein
MPDRPLPDQIPISRADEVAAIQAYEQAAEVQKYARHRLDLVDAPARPRHRGFDGGIPPRAADRRGAAPEVTHGIASPTGTAFKLGFGFAAGVAAFRAIVLAVVGVVLLAVSAQVFHRLFG